MVRFCHFSSSFFSICILLLVFCLVQSPLVAARSETIEQPADIELTSAEKTWIKRHPIIRVGGGPDWAPFDFVDDRGDYAGIAWDFLTLIGERTGLTFSVEVAPWSENVRAFKRGELDLLPAVYITEPRKKFMEFSSPFHEMLDFFFISERLHVKTLDDLKGKHVAIPKDYAHIDFLAQNFPDIEVLTVETLGDAIDMVLENRADMLYDSYAIINYKLEKEGIKTIVPFRSTRNIGNKFIHFATQKSMPELSRIIQKGLDSITYKERRKIQNRWLSSLMPSKDDFASTLSKKDVLWLRQHPHLRFAGDPNWLPYEAFDANGQYVGIVAEYLKLIQARLGITVDIIATDTWDQTLEKVRRGEVDIVSETTDSGLSAHMTFTDSYLASPIVIVMKSSEHYVDELSHIANKKIALITDYGYVNSIKQGYPDINFVQVDSIQEGLTAVSTGEVDALLATLAQASYHISELGVHNVRIVGKTEFSTRLAFGVAKELEPLVSLFNRAIADISQSEKQAVLDEWGAYQFSTRIDYWLVAKIVCAFLLLIAFILFWNRKLAKEIELRKEAEAQTETLITHIPLHVVVTSPAGEILTANPQALKDYGVSIDKIGLFNIKDLYVDENDRVAVAEEIASKGSVNQKIVDFKRLDGEVRSMMISVMPIRFYNREALLSIAVDFTARKELEAQMRDAKEKAETASRAKSEFLANMSHEIRTPMNAVIGFTDILYDEVTDTRHKSYLKTIKSAGNDLLLLINDILDLSKIEAGKVEIVKGATDLHVLLAELNNIFSLSSHNKGVDFLVDIDANLPNALLLDVVRLRQVLVNLIGNAIKFTESGSVEIHARAAKYERGSGHLNLIIEVMDSGIGIPSSQLESIFEEFKQQEGQESQQFGGTGLGLSISKRLVELMGGRLSVQSQINKGSTFTVSLDRVEVVEGVGNNVCRQAQAEANPEKFAEAVVLVVDDVEPNRRLVSDLLSGSALTIMEAVNGREAVNIVRENAVDLVLMDLRMPVMDGYEAAAIIKSESLIPVVALTASVMKDDLDQLKTEHFDGYIRKPFNRAELFQTLGEFLGYNKRADSVPEKGVPELTASESAVVSSVLEFMQGKMSAWEKIKETNNVSDVKRWASELNAYAHEKKFRPLANYAAQLLNKVEVFDIKAIASLLNDYPALYENLVALSD